MNKAVKYGLFVAGILLCLVIGALLDTFLGLRGTFANLGAGIAVLLFVIMLGCVAYDFLAGLIRVARGDDRRRRRLEDGD